MRLYHVNQNEMYFAFLSKRFLKVCDVFGSVVCEKVGDGEEDNSSWVTESERIWDSKFIRIPKSVLVTSSSRMLKTAELKYFLL